MIAVAAAPTAVQCADIREISVVGKPTVLYRFPQQKCDQIDLPDAPARAFRDYTGMIHLFATHYVNRELVGPDFSSLHHVCTPAFVGKHDPRPDAYDDYGWLSGFFTSDGRTVYGIIHNEFHGNERPSLCASGVYLRCWENSVTAAISNDNGTTFSRIPGMSGVIADLPYRYAGDQAHQFGYFNPTNIVQFNGFVYFFVSLIDPINKRAGACLVRSANVSDPTSWHGWDGRGFGVQFVNPYAPMVGDPEQHICHLIGEGRLMFSLGSVSFYKPAQVFIMVMRRQRWEHGIDDLVPGVYFSTSPDLINWSPPHLIITDAEASSNADVVQFYPSMLDPDGGDPNFDQVSAWPSLLSIQFEPKHVNQQRQLVVRKLEIRGQSMNYDTH